MNYKIIFASGDETDYLAIEREQRGDVLILDESGQYFGPIFITLKRIAFEYSAKRVCYLESNMVIVREPTIATILKSIPELHWWAFNKAWLPLSEEEIAKFYGPSEKWLIYDVYVDDDPATRML